MCGETTRARDRFCSACGVDLDAQVLLEPTVATPSTDTSADEERRNLSMLFVPLGVVVAIGLAVLVLVSGGDDEPEPDSAADVVEAPTATPLPTPTATPFRVTLPESTPPQPTPTRTPSAPQTLGVTPADLSRIPTTDATHLAIAHDRDLVYLDLVTGEWIIHERVSTSSVPGVDSLVPFGGGVVTSSGESVFYIPIDGRPVTLGPGQALGVVDDLVYLRDWSSPGGSTIVAFDETGENAGTLGLPVSGFAVDVLPMGVFLIEAGGQIFSGTTSETEVVATGSLAGVAGNRILVFTCETDVDSCRHLLIDVASGTQVEVPPEVTPRRDMRLAPDGRILAVRLGGEQATAYRIDDTGAVVDEEDLNRQDVTLTELGLVGPALATDATGLYARIEGDRLLFHGPTGEAITEVALDFLPGFGDSYALAFVTAGS